MSLFWYATMFGGKYVGLVVYMCSSVVVLKTMFLYYWFDIWGGSFYSGDA